MTKTTCPCSSGKPYEECCALLHQGQIAVNPEQLMRSRYTAFAIGDCDYLLRTSSLQLVKSLTKEDLEQTCQAFDFISLEIKQSGDDKVEFLANLLHGDELHPLHETSVFVEEQGQWKYDSGQLHTTPVTKLRRNDKCPCGSGKKFKQCHMK